VFRSKDDTKFAKELLGDAEVNRLGEMYASNEIKGLDSKGVAKWMESNDFYKEVPGLSEKLKQYQTSLAEREGQRLALEGMQKEIATEIKSTVDSYSQFLENINKEIGQAATNKEKVVKTLNEAKELFRVKTASEISPKWEKLRVELENTGLFNPQELDALGTSVAEAARSEARSQKVQEFFDKFKGILSLKFLRKL
jgi:flagellar biosynthesis chaperone FliJ